MTANSAGTGGGSGPTLMSDGGAYQYGVYADAGGACYAVRWTRSTRAVSAGPYNLAGIAGNPLNLPLEENDSHEAPSIGVDSQGRSWIAANMFHSDPPRVVRSTNTGVTSWTNVSSQFYFPVGEEAGYFNFLRFSDGGLMVIYRIRLSTGGVGNRPGGERVYYLAPGADTMVDRGYVTCGAGGTEDAFYRNTGYVDANDTVHLFGAWDASWGGGETVNGFSYLKTADRGLTWSTITGAALTPTITKTNASGVAMRTGISYDSDLSNLYSSGCTLDANGYPCGTYSKFGQAQRIVRWNGSAWVIDTSAGAYYGGGTILPILNFKSSVWSLTRNGTLVELRNHDGANHEVIKLGGNVTTGWHQWHDPVALRQYGTVEILIPDGTPRVHVVGDRVRMAAA